MSRRKRNRKTEKPMHLPAPLAVTKLVLIVSAILAVLFLGLWATWPLATKKLGTSLVQNWQLERLETHAPIDEGSWEEYLDKEYGFSLKHPSGWQVAEVLPSARKDQWRKRYQFRRQEVGNEQLSPGFDVVVYNTQRVRNLFQTAEFPGKKQLSSEDDSLCPKESDYQSQTEEIDAQEIYVPIDSDCFYPTLFYNFSSRGWLYNLVPVWKNEQDLLTTDPQDEVSRTFAEFPSIAESFKLLEIKKGDGQSSIVAPRPMPKISAPFPATFARAGGRLVCNKKNDKPSKSDKNKKVHMDMECCLDPDEIPNPHCYYSVEKYGKYLNRNPK